MREFGNRRVEGIVLGFLGTLHFGEGRLDEARAHTDQGLAVLRQVRDPMATVNLLCQKAHLEHGAATRRRWSPPWRRPRPSRTRSVRRRTHPTRVALATARRELMPG